MIAVLLSPFYILFNLYILRWLLQWLGACKNYFKKTGCKILVSVLYAFFALAMLVAFFLPAGQLQRIMKLVGNYWLGVLAYVILTVVGADVLRFLLKRINKIPKEKLHARKTFVICGALCILLILTISLWGVANAKKIHTTEYKLTIHKKAGSLKNLKVVLLADLHLGYNTGCKQMEKMVKKVNEQNPDLIVIAGDIFDNEYEALDHPQRLVSILKGMKSKYGVYAVYGNHDIREKILAGFTFSKKGEKKVSDLRMDQFIEDAGIQLLRDESVLIADSFYLYGRPDYERLGRGIEKRKTPEEITQSLDLSKPVIVIDHEPRELQELADAGVDLDLCGHTHDGQTFPGNLTIKLFWENPCGYMKKGEMHNIVTSGIGVFGPNMRVGTRAEICPIHITFE